MASRACTVLVKPCTSRSRAMLTPRRLGRFFARWAKIPTLGQSVLPRG